MRASLKNRWLYLANPRCGSTSLRKALDPYSDLFSAPKARGEIRHHWTAREATEYLAGAGHAVEEFAVFTTVRHPWARTVSAFLFGERNPKSVWAKTLAEGPAFSTFIRHPRVSERLFNLAVFTRGAATPVKVIAVEKLESARPFVEETIGGPLDVPRLNESPNHDYRTFFGDRADIDWIASLFASDIEAMGYAYDDLAPARHVIEV